MPVRFSQLESIVTADIRDHERKLAQAERSAQSKSRSIQAAFDRVKGFSAKFNISGGSGGSGGGLFGAAGAIASGNLLTAAISKIGGAMLSGVQTGIEYNKLLESSTVSFETLIGSADAARKHLADLQKFGATTPFELPGLIKSSQLMQGMGFKVQQIIPMLTGVGNALSAMGRNGEDEIQRVTLALGQMASKGKVSAEEMMQLTEAGLPAWDLLARAIGKTVAETQKLAEAGKLKGREAAIAITQQANLKYAGQMTKMAGTLQGLESNFNDILRQRLGEGSKGATEFLKKFYADAGAGMGTAAAEQFVKTFNEGVMEFTKTLDPMLKGIADGSYFTTATQGMRTVDSTGKAINSYIGADKTAQSLMQLLQGRADKMTDPVDRAVFGAMIKGFKWLGSFGDEKGQEFGDAFGAGAQAGAEKRLEIKSPSRVFIGIGMNAAKGYAQGLLEGLQKFVAPAMDEMLMGGKKNQRALPLPDRANLNLDKLLEREPGFIKKLEEIANKLQTKPEWLLQLMALETAGSFNPAIRGGYKGLYTGLIQFGPGARKDVGLPYKTDEAEAFLKSISGTQQLDYVFKYLDQKRKQFGALDSLAKLYAAVGAGHYLANDETVMFRQGGFQKGDDPFNKRISGAGFTANPSWNVIKDSVIQQKEFGMAAAGALRLSDALEALGNTVTKLTQSLAPQITLAERQALYNPGGAYAATSPLAQSQTMRQIFGGSDSVDIAESLEKIPLALDTLGDAAKLNLKPLLQLPPALQGVTEAHKQQLLGAKEIVQQTDHLKALQESYADVFQDLIQGLTSGSDQVTDTLRSFFRGLITSTINEIQSAIIEKATGGSYSSLAGWLGGALGGVISGFFGIGGPTTATRPRIVGRAAGGNVFAGMPYIINENTPNSEFFVPSLNGHILTRRDAMAAVGNAAPARGTQHITINFHIATPDGRISRESQSQMAAKMAQVLRQASERNG